MLVSHKEGGVFIYLYVSSLTALPPPPLPFQATFVSFQLYCTFCKAKSHFDTGKGRSVSWADITSMCTRIISVSSQSSAGSHVAVTLEMFIVRG